MNAHRPADRRIAILALIGAGIYLLACLPSVSFSPNERYFAHVQWLRPKPDDGAMSAARPGPVALCVADRKTGRMQTLLETESALTRTAFLDDDTVVVGELPPDAKELCYLAIDRRTGKQTTLVRLGLSHLAGKRDRDVDGSAGFIAIVAHPPTRRLFVGVPVTHQAFGILEISLDEKKVRLLPRPGLFPVITPDGKTLAYFAPRRFDLDWRAVDRTFSTDERIEVADLFDALPVARKPDANELGGKKNKVNLEMFDLDRREVTARTTVHDDISPLGFNGPTIDLERGRLLVFEEHALAAYSIKDGSRTVLFEEDLGFVAIQPGGAAMVAMAEPDTNGPVHIEHIQLATGKRRTIRSISFHSDTPGIALSPSGDLLVVAAGMQRSERLHPFAFGMDIETGAVTVFVPSADDGIALLAGWAGTKPQKTSDDLFDGALVATRARIAELPKAERARWTVQVDEILARRKAKR